MEIDADRLLRPEQQAAGGGFVYCPNPMTRAMTIWCLAASVVGCGAAAATAPDGSPGSADGGSVDAPLESGGLDERRDVVAAETMEAGSELPPDLGPIGPVAFARHWSFVSGTTETSCTGRPTSTRDLRGQGLDVLLMQGGGLSAMFFCPWVFDLVAGTTMTALRPNQSCMNMAATTTYAWTGQTFVLTLTGADSARLSSTITGTFVDTFDNTSGTCTIRAMAQLE